MIDLAMLGTGGGMPMPNRYLSAALINYRGRKILVDCGEGTQVSMRMLGWGFKSIDIICITHIHGDHIVGLPGLLATIGNSGRTEPMLIVGPRGIKEVISGLRVIVPFLPYEINIMENPSSILLSVNNNNNLMIVDEKVNDIKIETLELEHSSPCLGFSFIIKRKRKFNVEKAMNNDVPKKLWNLLQKGDDIVENNRVYKPEMVLGDEREGIKITYITDTRPIDNIISFIYKSNLCVLEGTYGSDEDIEKAIKNKHMTFREAAILANKANVNELLLTHFTPAMVEPNEFLQNARDEFVNTFIAYDRLVKILKFNN